MSKKKASKKKKSVDEKATKSAMPMSHGSGQDRKLLNDRKKHLDERLRSLYQRTLMLEKELLELDTRFYRVCIFGSARIKSGTEAYDNVFELARFLAWEGIDILTGGGPGLMEAANKGAQLGKKEKNSKTLSFGISIQLEFEPSPNTHLDVKRHHHKFSSRLDDFMRLSDSVVVTPGGIGTLLELYFTWQLIQVKHMEPRPIVLLDSTYWNGIIEWMKQVPLERGLMGEKDFDYLKIVDTPEEAAKVIFEHHHLFLQTQKEKQSGSAGTR